MLILILSIIGTLSLYLTVHRNFDSQRGVARTASQAVCVCVCVCVCVFACVKNVGDRQIEKSRCKKQLLL